MKKILFVLGTRPEAIKLAPLILEFKANPDYSVFVCNTEQQKELSNQTLGFFGISCDFYLDVMTPNQSLEGVQQKILLGLSKIFSENDFDATIVQGDTMTVLCGALVSFYHKIPVFHIEAGLRSYNLSEPFPEEGIRQMVSRITTLHFAPTESSKAALIKEGILSSNIRVTGNTVIDALSCLKKEVLDSASTDLHSRGIDFNKEIVLVTAHRRENHGERLEEIIDAISELSNKYPTHQFVMPVHPNPNVKNKVHQRLSNIENVILTGPLDYPSLVCVMKVAKLILTDSGGIQEEGPSFGSPILVLRYETERQEGVEAGFAQLVGADQERIVTEAEKILSQDREFTRLDGRNNPYGDGFASKRILDEISSLLKDRN